MKHSIIKDIDTSNHPTRGIPLMRVDDIEEAERRGVVILDGFEWSAESVDSVEDRFSLDRGSLREAQ